MIVMNKKIILSLLLIAIFSLIIMQSSVYAYGTNLQGYEKTVSYPVDTINVTFDNDSIGVFANNNAELEWDLYQFINQESIKTGTDITNLKDGILDICREYGVENPKIVINTPYGKDIFLVRTRINGISMLPTLEDGQYVIYNKTLDVHKGDIVSAYVDNHGLVTKRVSKVDGNKIYLVSDNKNGTFRANGKTYEYEGYHGWVNKSDIYGVAIDY